MVVQNAQEEAQRNNNLYGCTQGTVDLNSYGATVFGNTQTLAKIMLTDGVKVHASF